MADGVVTQQVLLQFNRDFEAIRRDLSAVVQTPDGSLWLGSDEMTTVERLSPTADGEYGHQQQFRLGDYIELEDDESEIDIEGMDYADGYLWVIGSHAVKRKRVKRAAHGKAIERLAKIETDVNRYVLARFPVLNGSLVKEDKALGVSAACLAKSEDNSALTKALEKDEHIGAFLKAGLPAKENGFDIEGLAVRENRAFVGLRGPVIGGMAIILEIEMSEKKKGQLRLNRLNNNFYRKHFVDLNGLGIRDLCFEGDDLIVLAGPTMLTATTMQVFRFRSALDHDGDTLWVQPCDRLTKLFDLPLQPNADNAEGIALWRDKDCDRSPSLCVVYDSPAKTRLVGDDGIFADVFSLT